MLTAAEQIAAGVMQFTSGWIILRPNGARLGDYLHPSEAIARPPVRLDHWRSIMTAKSATWFGVYTASGNRVDVMSGEFHAQEVAYNLTKESALGSAAGDHRAGVEMKSGRIIVLEIDASILCSRHEGRTGDAGRLASVDDFEASLHCRDALLTIHCRQV
jgi:hypothetical protein